MDYITGTPKLFDDVTYDDIIQYPIWLVAFNVTGVEDDQVYQQPVLNSDNITADLENPFITLSIKNTDHYISAEYYFEREMLNKIDVWNSEDEIRCLKFPIILVAVPKIDGVELVEFLWTDPELNFAFRV